MHDFVIKETAPFLWEYLLVLETMFPRKSSCISEVESFYCGTHRPLEIPRTHRPPQGVQGPPWRHSPCQWPFLNFSETRNWSHIRGSEKQTTSKTVSIAS